MESIESVGLTPTAAMQNITVLEQRKKTLVLWLPNDALVPLRRKLLSLLQNTGDKVILVTENDFAGMNHFCSAEYLWVWVLGDDYSEHLPPYPFERCCAKTASDDETEARNGDVPFLVLWDTRRNDHRTDKRQKEFWHRWQNLPSDRLTFLQTDDPLHVVASLKDLMQSGNHNTNVLPEYPFVSLVLSDDESWWLECRDKTPALKANPAFVIRPEEVANRTEDILNICRKSRRILLFYKEKGEWAFSYAKQLWKQLEGVASGKKLYLIGDKSVNRNKYLKWEANAVEVLLADASGWSFLLENILSAPVLVGNHLPDVCPYNGLRPYAEDDALYFCGRERLTQTLLQRLSDQRWAVVAGASGDGKSSLIYAGLIPSLKSGGASLPSVRWKTITFKPEKNPLRNLAQALAHRLSPEDHKHLEDQLSVGINALVRILSDYLQEHPGENILILLDQFEEFFTHSENYKDGMVSVSAQWTVSLLMETIKAAQTERLPVYVVFTMRSDYIGHCVAFRDFSIGENLFFVPRLQHLEVKKIIEQPVRLSGGKIAHRLTQRLLNDISEGNDQLPVLQHCLQQIRQAAHVGQDTVLDLIHYAQVGGLDPDYLDEEQRHDFNNWFVKLSEADKAYFQHPGLKNVLNRHADELIAHAHEYYAQKYRSDISKEDTLTIIRTAFTGLTRVDNGKMVRHRLTLREITALVGKPHLDTVIVGRVLNIFREPEHTFLLPALTQDPESHDLEPDTLIDITHEALIRNWEQLKLWVEEDHKNERLFLELTAQYVRWDQHKRSAPYLLNRGLSSYFSSWFQKLQPNADQISRYVSFNRTELQGIHPKEGWLPAFDAFLKKSLNRNLRAQRGIQVGLVMIIGLLFVTAYLYFNVLHKAKETEQKNTRILAQQNELNDKRRIIEEKLAGENEAVKIKSENERLARERAVLEEQVRQDSLLGKVRSAEKDIEIERLKREQSEKEARLKQIERDNALRDRELALIRNKEVADLNAKITNESRQTAKQRDEALITQSLFLANKANEQVKTGQPEIGILLSLEALPQDLSNPDRPYVPQAEASLYFATNAIVNKQPAVSWAGHKNKITSTRFNFNGTKIVSTSWDRTAKVRDAKTGQLLKDIYHPHIVRQASFSKDDRFILTVADDFTARLYDGKFYSPVNEFAYHQDVISHATLSPDATQLLTTCYDGTAVLWNVYKNKPAFIFKGHQQAVIYGDFSPDGNKIVTVSQDQTARLWNAHTGGLIAVLTGHSRPLTHAVFSPDGHTLATASKDQTIRLWNGTTGQGGTVLAGHGGAVQHLCFDPSGQRLASASTDGSVRIWNINSAATISVLREHGQEVFYVQFSSDGQRLISSGRELSTILWDTKHYLFLARFYGQSDQNYHPVLSPDGKKLLLADKDLTVKEYTVLPEGQALLQLARRQVKNRTLSLEERKKFHVNEE